MLSSHYFFGTPLGLVPSIAPSITILPHLHFLPPHGQNNVASVLPLLPWGIVLVLVTAEPIYRCSVLSTVHPGSFSSTTSQMNVNSSSCSIISPSTTIFTLSLFLSATISFVFLMFIDMLDTLLSCASIALASLIAISLVFRVWWNGGTVFKQIFAL